MKELIASIKNLFSIYERKRLIRDLPGKDDVEKQFNVSKENTSKLTREYLLSLGFLAEHRDGDGDGGFKDEILEQVEKLLAINEERGSIVNELVKISESIKNSIKDINTSHELILSRLEALEKPKPEPVNKPKKTKAKKPVDSEGMDL